jgi:hypothetical protein
LLASIDSPSNQVGSLGTSQDIPIPSLLQRLALCNKFCPPLPLRRLSLPYLSCSLLFAFSLFRISRPAATGYLGWRSSVTAFFATGVLCYIYVQQHLSTASVSVAESPSFHSSTPATLPVHAPFPCRHAEPAFPGSSWAIFASKPAQLTSSTVLELIFVQSLLIRLEYDRAYTSRCDKHHQQHHLQSPLHRQFGRRATGLFKRVGGSGAAAHCLLGQRRRENWLSAWTCVNLEFTESLEQRHWPPRVRLHVDGQGNLSEVSA